MHCLIALGILFLFVGWFSFFFQGVFFLTVFGWHLKNFDIHLCIFYFLFLSLHLLLLSLFLPSFYGCMEEVLVLVFSFSCFFFSSGMEMEWKGGGMEVTEEPSRMHWIGFCRWVLFIFFFLFYVLLFYFCAGHFDRVSFSFLTCIVLYSFFLILTF